MEPGIKFAVILVKEFGYDEVELIIYSSASGGLAGDSKVPTFEDLPFNPRTFNPVNSF